MAKNKNIKELIDRDILDEVQDEMMIEDQDIIADGDEGAEIISQDEEVDQASEALIELEPEYALRLLEALIFAANEPMTIRALSERFPRGHEDKIEGFLAELKARYDGRGINLVERDGRYAFRTAADLGDALTFHREISRKLTKAAIETLAIVAYHQPVTRTEIESIRGVAISRGTLDALMEAGWVKPGRRREIPGRPVTWITTPKFLDHFGLENIKDLPGMDDLKAAGLLDKRPAIENVPGTSDLFDGKDKTEMPNMDVESDHGFVSDHVDDDQFDRALAEESSEEVEQ
jgi:segregation and condensation protein B